MPTPNRGTQQTRDTLGEVPDRTSPVNPIDEERYWREAYPSQPYYERDHSYDDYAPAYRTGWESYKPGREWREDDLKAAYEKSRGKGRLAWEKARHAVKAAWDRVSDAAEDYVPGGAGRR